MAENLYTWIKEMKNEVSLQQSIGAAHFKDIGCSNY